MWLSVLFISSLLYIFLTILFIVVRVDYVSLGQNVSKDYTFGEQEEIKESQPQPSKINEVEESKDELYSTSVSPDGLTYDVQYNRALVNAYNKTLKG